MASLGALIGACAFFISNFVLVRCFILFANHPGLRLVSCSLDFVDDIVESLALILILLLKILPQKLESAKKPQSIKTHEINR